MGRRCETCLVVRGIISPTKDRMFLAGHPSQGCFVLQSHCALCYFFNQAFYPSDFSFMVELLDDWNVDVPSWKHPRNLELPRVSSPGFSNDSKRMVINRRSTVSDLSRQLSSATDTTVSRQTVYRRLGHIGLYARRPVRSVPLTATLCRRGLAWSREHALWTPQQWCSVMFSDESRFSLQSDLARL
ncbi:transposable element Tcb1 transposase [Trichonephila clavipes]|nr:transposable element Tcb1 transposase [Trichonephila clavipes]